MQVIAIQSSIISVIMVKKLLIIIIIRIIR